MRSFAVIAGLAASANAYAYGYPAYNETAPSSAPVYEAASTPAAYPVSSAAAYPVSSAAAYPVSSAVEYPSYTTKVVTGLTTVCAEPTTISVGTKTYTVTSSTTIVDEDCEYTTTVPVHPTSAPAAATSGHPTKPSVVAPPVVPYPSKNGTAPTYPAGTAAPAPSASATKSAPPSQFTGAAVQAGAGFMAIVAAAAAFL
jgi:hypothetical protein